MWGGIQKKSIKWQVMPKMGDIVKKGGIRIVWKIILSQLIYKKISTLFSRLERRESMNKDQGC